MTDHQHLPIFRNSIPRIAHIAKVNRGLKICVRYDHSDKDLAVITGLSAKSEDQIIKELMTVCNEQLDERVAYFSQNRSATKHRSIDDISPTLSVVLEKSS